MAGQPGDFNGDAAVNGDDLNLICAALQANQNALQFDLNGDGQLNHDDLDMMVQDILKTVPGDANLDGRFNSSDLVQTLQAGGYEDNIDGNATWATGDWNCDGDFDSTTLISGVTFPRRRSSAATSSVMKCPLVKTWK